MKIYWKQQLNLIWFPKYFTPILPKTLEEKSTCKTYWAKWCRWRRDTRWWRWRASWKSKSSLRRRRSCWARRSGDRSFRCICCSCGSAWNSPSRDTGTRDSSCPWQRASRGAARHLAGLEGTEKSFMITNYWFLEVKPRLHRLLDPWMLLWRLSILIS